MSYLILGNGYLGKKFADYFGGILYTQKINSQADMDSAIEFIRPSYVINCAGKTGRPNIDWCESHKEETFFSNVVLPTYILKSCQKFSAKMIHIGSGCIYQGDNNGLGYSEDSAPNFDGSYYSWTKIVSERFLSNHDVLQIRIRMPISGEPNPRNLLTKLLGYTKIVYAHNSVTCIPDLLFIARQLIEKNANGIYNVVNSLSITHNDILSLYSSYSKKKLNYEIISKDELKYITKAPRSNCTLSTKKLEAEGIISPSCYRSVGECIKEYIILEDK